MSTRKDRISEDGPSPYQQLKDLPWDEREWLWAQRRKMSAKQIIGHIEGRYGIYGLVPQRLSAFWKYQGDQQELREMNEDAASFREAFARDTPIATLEEVHEATLFYFSLRAKRKGSDKLMAFALSEIRKARAIQEAKEKRKLAERTKTEQGLDAIGEESKGDPEAIALFEQFRARITEITK